MDPLPWPTPVVPLQAPAPILSLPADLVVKCVPTNGWCFYDCVREHLVANVADGEFVPTTPGIAALCLSCLALQREYFEEVLADSDDIRSQRRENVF